VSEENAAALRRAAVADAPWSTSGSGERFPSLRVARDLWDRRELVALLTRREVRSRFKDSNLGLLWSFARPLAQFLVYFVALGQILGLARQIPDFAIFVFVGLTGWLFFSEAVQKATSSIVINASLVKKVQLPREVFPISAIGSVGFMSVVQVVVLILALMIISGPPLLAALPYAVAGLIVLVLFTTAVGLLLAALNVHFRDIEHLVEVVMVVLFWASPVVYSFTFVHNRLGGNWLEQAYLANPVTIAVLGLQRGLWNAGADEVWPDFLWIRLLVMIAVSAAALVIAHVVFIRREGDFAEEI